MTTFHRPSRAPGLAVPFLAGISLVAAACGGDTAASGDAAGLVTSFDSTRADSIIARTAGQVARADVRRVTEELRIAPTADDTSLFAEVSEFDVGLDGRLFVFDRAANVLFVFDSAGTLERRVGRTGSGPGEFRGNNGMVVLPDGRLAVWDASNGRVSHFAADGSPLSSVTVPSGFVMSNGLRTDRSGALRVVNPVTEPRDGDILGRLGLVRLTDAGGFTDSLVGPDLPVERILYVARADDGATATPPTHAARHLWQWHPEGYFVSANSGRYEIEVSRPDSLGGAVRIVRDAEAVPVPEGERRWDEERVLFQMRRNVPGWTWQGPPIPGTKPPISALHVGRDGALWVRVATPSEPIPEAELDPQLPARAPRPLYREAVEYEVFDPDGRFRGRVSLPLRSTLMESDGDMVWFLQRDQDGLPAVVRARVEPSLG